MEDNVHQVIAENKLWSKKRCFHFAFLFHDELRLKWQVFLLDTKLNGKKDFGVSNIKKIFGHRLMSTMKEF